MRFLRMAPGALPRAIKKSCLPSDSLTKSAAVRWPRPLASRRFVSAGVALPSASNPIFAGINFSTKSCSGACSNTLSIKMAKRLGVAKLRLLESSASSDNLSKSALMELANASPKRCKAFGGNSSVKSSIKRALLVMLFCLLYRCLSQHREA